MAEYDIQSTNSGNDETTKYFLKDHLESIDVVRVYDGHIAGLDSSTNKTKDEYLSYDAFGQRRAVSTWANSLTLVSAYSDRGFTDHEHLEDFGLIHMNGRIYDPLLGRFLSADPNVQSPKNTQSLNRFSYVMNNPLSATDPTGYFSFSKFMHKWMPIILQIGMMAASGGLTAWGQAALGGFMGFAMSGGDVRAGLVAAATAGMFHGVGSAFGAAPQNYLLSGYHMGKILAHGIVGGVSSKMGGGNFADGFRSAAVTQAFAPGIDEIYKDVSGVAAKASRITVAAIVGGTASEAGGGKFANGAVTGAFSRAFNDDAPAHKRQTLRRQLDRVYLTGHQVGGVGPVHLAMEYSAADGSGASWISAGPEGVDIEGSQYLRSGQNGARPTDAPSRNFTVGEVSPPPGVSPGDYFRQLVQADQIYCDCADYDLFPGQMDSYNSNSFVSGLVRTTGGTPSVDLSNFVGGQKPLPPVWFGR